MKYYIIAGEASGDLHSSNLIKELKLLDRNADFRCWGGDLMQAQGAKIVRHYKDAAYMGFLEVFRHLPSILNNITFCKKDIVNYNPDALILVDYPGFNLRIAEFAKQNNIRTFYYISPQVWAWKSSRVYQIKKNIDRMFVILPFEKEFYHKYDYDVDFVGHPLLDEIANYNNKIPNEQIYKSGLPIVALLPGSRKQEIAKMLSVMLKVIPSFPDYQFVIAGIKSIPKEFYEQYISALKSHASQLKIVYNQTYQLLLSSKAALVTSGTATLETALFGIPEVVCYKGSYFSYWLAKRFIKVKFISLVNLIMDKKVVTELIQRDFNINNLNEELRKLLTDDKTKTQISRDYKELKEVLGGSGASHKTAELIVSMLKK